MYIYDMRKLKGKIIEKCGNLGTFAQAMGWSTVTNGKKVSGERLWDQCEIEKACNVLEIPFDEIVPYFFTRQV